MAGRKEEKNDKIFPLQDKKRKRFETIVKLRYNKNEKFTSPWRENRGLCTPFKTRYQIIRLQII